MKIPQNGRKNDLINDTYDTSNIIQYFESVKYNRIIYSYRQ